MVVHALAAHHSLLQLFFMRGCVRELARRTVMLCPGLALPPGRRAPLPPIIFVLFSFTGPCALKDKMMTSEHPVFAKEHLGLDELHVCSTLRTDERKAI